MEPTTPNFVWTADHPAWLAEALDRLNWSYQDLDQALGYGASRGSYTRQIVACGRVPSVEYQRRLFRWWANKPQPKPRQDFLFRIQTVAVPWLRARQGRRMAQCYTRRRAEIARKRLGRG